MADFDRVCANQLNPAMMAMRDTIRLERVFLEWGVTKGGGIEGDRHGLLGSNALQVSATLSSHPSVDPAVVVRIFPLRASWVPGLVVCIG